MPGQVIVREPYASVPVGKPWPSLVVSPGTLLVLAGGFEERARAILRILEAGETLFDCVAILRYNSDPVADAGLALQMRDEVEPVAERDPVLIDVDVDSPTESVFKIRAAISELVREMRLRRALIDISGMTHMFAVGVLDACVASGLQESIFYAEAAEYFPLRTDAEAIEAEARDRGTYDYWELLQSEGLQSVHIHPSFGGSLRMNMPVALAVFLGFEPSRVRGLLDEYAPAGVVALVGKSPHSSFAWRSRLSWRLHEPFLSRWPLVQEDVSTFYFEQILETLERIYSRLGSEYDFAIAVQCGKLQMLASYWFWQAHPEVQLVFTCPIAFNRDRYSRGTGPCHLLVRDAGGIGLNRDQ